MNKQELLEKIKALKPDEQCLHEYQPEEWEAFQDGFDDGKCYVELIIEQLDEPVRPPEPKPLEPEKPVVPRYVADFYESIKDDFEYGVYELCVNFYNCDLSGKIKHWFDCNDTNPIQVLVNMHQFGYEVEKEKLYTVELPNPNGGTHLVLCKDCDGKLFFDVFFSEEWKTFGKCKLTESEIKKDFEWAWQFAKEVEND